MAEKFSDWNDTIVALATPPGIGAIGIIRVSGKNAIDIINEMFESKDLAVQKTHTIHVCILKYENELLD